MIAGHSALLRCTLPRVMELFVVIVFVLLVGLGMIVWEEWNRHA